MEAALEYYRQQLEQIQQAGLSKMEHVITSPQGAVIDMLPQEGVLNFCCNNYLGLANHPKVLQAAHQALEQKGYGMSSVRFICGTQDAHQQLEKRLADWVGTDEAILYSSCFDANGGLFETLLDENDVVISDQLNHASIVDGIRLCKATRRVFSHADMGQLEELLKQSMPYRFRLIVTDGVFSMDGDLAKLDKIIALAKKYTALVMVDDSHATGVIGASGRGTAEHYQLLGKVDIITSTLGKALGGGCGGFTAAHSEIIQLLRQRSRPYLFSNSLPPTQIAAALQALSLLSQSSKLVSDLQKKACYMRQSLSARGFNIKPGDHPIIPIMLYEAKLAELFSEKLIQKGIFAVGFSYPVVPKGQARIRIQVSAAHTYPQIDQAINVLSEIEKSIGRRA